MATLETHMVHHKGHTPYNKRPGQVNATATAYFTTHPAGEWLGIRLEETVTNLDGREVSRNIAVDLSPREARDLQAWLATHLPALGATPAGLEAEAQDLLRRARLCAPHGDPFHHDMQRLTQLVLGLLQERREAQPAGEGLARADAYS